MSLYAIGDTHLSFGTDKPMDIFRGWQNFEERLEKNWNSLVTDDDTVVIAGDISWAMNIEGAKEDFRFLDRLKGKKLIITDCISGKGIDELEEEVKNVLSEKIERYREKGMSGRTVKAMVLGIPNVGKSSLINKLSGSKKANVENRPGVTLNKQWVKTNIGMDLLDMPGVLWPKFDDRIVGENLAITGAIKDAVLLKDEIAMILCQRLKKRYPDLLCSRYDLDKSEIEYLDGYDIFELIGKKRGLLIKGGEVNFDRCATMLLDEFRRGVIGKITLE